MENTCNTSTRKQRTMNSLTPQVAVIILNWNGERLLKEYLSTVVRHTPAIGRVVVADNGSTDGSLELLRSEFPQVEVMAFDRNYGFAEGYNRDRKSTRLNSSHLA